MADIKIKKVEDTVIKTSKDIGIVSEKVRNAGIRTKENINSTTEQSNSNSPEQYAVEKVQEKAKEAADYAAYEFNHQGKKSVVDTKNNIETAKLTLDEVKARRKARQAKNTVNNTQVTVESDITFSSQPEASKPPIKNPLKKADNVIKTGNAQSVKASAKTANTTAVNTVKKVQTKQLAVSKTAEKSRKAAQRLRQTAKEAKKFASQLVKFLKNALKAAYKAAKSLVSLIIACGWISVVIIIFICLFAALASSFYGIFFSTETSDTGLNIKSVIQEINNDYDNKIEEIKSKSNYDEVEINGTKANWKDILSIYAVKTTTDQNNPMEIATMDDNKKQLLKDIFWQMNSISSRTETKTETEIIETDDGHGNIIQTEKKVTRTYLYITVSHKTPDEMANQYGFNKEQQTYLKDLLKDENNSLWSQVLYGVANADDSIVQVALTQVGNVGGQPYWSWYGFNSRVEWCACFVSWCANECGYIDAGVVPKFAGCVTGVQWFKDRGQWADNTIEPSPGMIIFFDWDNKGSSGPQDGLSDHVGIVEKVENGVVYTVEGNSGDSCRRNQYSVGHYEILGYGIPAY